MQQQSEDQLIRSVSMPVRSLPIDLLRGLIMVLMALDHANYFIAQLHSSGEYWGGAIPEFPTTMAFITRFVTHYCAPGFFFLMGIGMMLFAHARRRRGWTEWQIIRHFLIRGSFLILLQLTLINFFWRLGPFGFPSIYIGVLVALGSGMIIASFLLRLNTAQLLILALAFFFGTELLHPDPSLWNLLETDPFNLILLRSGGTPTFWSNYPVLAWMELILFGIAFGQWLTRSPEATYRRAAILGIAFLMLFLVLRMLDGFGNIRPRPGDGWMDFLSLVKYPPSMTFTLFTMGGNLLLLWGFSHLTEAMRRAIRPLVLFGQEPLFFYILHLPGYAGLGRWLTPDGSSLWVMYALWLFGLVWFYAIIRAYARFKQSRAPDSLWRYL
jgi:uncharacterized membrane protein